MQALDTFSFCTEFVCVFERAAAARYTIKWCLFVYLAGNYVHCSRK